VEAVLRTEEGRNDGHDGDDDVDVDDGWVVSRVMVCAAVAAAAVVVAGVARMLMMEEMSTRVVQCRENRRPRMTMTMPSPDSRVSDGTAC